MAHTPVAHSSAPFESLVWGPRVVCYKGGPQGSLGCGVVGDPAGEFPEGFRGGFRAPLEGTPSWITISYLMPEPCLPEMIVKL